MKPKPIWLDYGKAGRQRKLLPNLSAVATAGDYLWTASDEMRSIECLEPRRGGYRLRRQYRLDKLFPGLPGAEEGDETDIEAMDVFDGRLWVCGSHSLTRRSHEKQRSDRVDPAIHERPSRCLLGSLPLSSSGGEIEGKGVALPFAESGDLRASLLSNVYLSPFAALPSKENGLDIEGMTIRDGKLFLGLRGPVVDNIAIVAQIDVGEALAGRAANLQLHLIDLEGLGVRDLACYKSGFLILAGPVSSADGPFALLRWKPKRTIGIQSAKPFRPLPSGLDHPEAICLIERRGKRGILVLYDTEDKTRISDTAYRADWFAL
jgi:hypothetical protein